MEGLERTRLRCTIFFTFNSFSEDSPIPASLLFSSCSSQDASLAANWTVNGVDVAEWGPPNSAGQASETTTSKLMFFAKMRS